MLQWGEYAKPNEHHFTLTSEQRALRGLLSKSRKALVRKDKLLVGIALLQIVCQKKSKNLDKPQFIHP